jgi:hypothetical protein
MLMVLSESVHKYLVCSENCVFKSQSMLDAALKHNIIFRHQDCVVSSSIQCTDKSLERPVKEVNLNKEIHKDADPILTINPMIRQYSKVSALQSKRENRDQGSVQ